MKKFKFIVTNQNQTIKKSEFQLILFNSKTNSKIISDLIKLIKRPQKLHGTILLLLRRLNKNKLF